MACLLPIMGWFENRASGRAGGQAGGREGGREGRREGGRERDVVTLLKLQDTEDSRLLEHCCWYWASWCCCWYWAPPRKICVHQAVSMRCPCFPRRIDSL